MKPKQRRSFSSLHATPSGTLTRSAVSPKADTKDLGFGTKDYGAAQRLINPDGSFNVERRGTGPLGMLNFYHSLISMSWTKFNLLVLTAYVLTNLLFACVYMMIGMDHVAGVVAEGPLDSFLEAFFFSAQTFTTVGYGRLNPVGADASTVAALESMFGLMGFALATGVLFGKFSRPVARLAFSEYAIIAPYHGISAFEFRIANKRANQLIDMRAEVTFSRMVTRNGKRAREFDSLKLERDRIMFFPTNWTVVHPIDRNSPLYGMSEDELHESDAEFLILLTAIDDTFSQTVHTRSSYKDDEVIWGAKFANMIERKSYGGLILELDKVGAIERVPLPELAMMEA